MSQELQYGTRLFHNKYSIIKILGSGGFGITYLANDTERNYYVAIKEYFPKTWCSRKQGSTVISVTHDENKDLVLKGKKRFIKEASNLKKLNNPNIVKVYGEFEENGTAYFVMEYIEGETLAQRIARKGPMNPADAVRLMDRLCDTVAYIHSRNMTHFDLKPQNIMLRANNDHPVIIDFGLSKQYDTDGGATSSMMFAHSEGYSAIELYGSSIGENVFSPQTDIYSLGAILYFMLKGVRPPEALRLQDISLPSANIPSYLYLVIKKAMAFSKKDRYSRVDLFKTDIDKAVKGIDPFSGNEETELGPKTTTNTNVSSPSFNGTTYGNGTSQNGSPDTGNKESILQKYWWILVLAAIIVCGIIFARGDFSNNDNQNMGIDQNSQQAETSVEEITIDNEPVIETPKISTFATRSFSLSGYNYKEKFDLKAENGILYVNSVENGQSKSDQFKYNSNVDAEKILDQFQGMANFWAATYVAPFIINDVGFYSEPIMNSTLKFLKTAMDFMDSNKGDCPTAYSALKSWHSQFFALHKDWLKEDSPSGQKWDQWESELEMLNYGMNENPIKPKDIYGL